MVLVWSSYTIITPSKRYSDYEGPYLTSSSASFWELSGIARESVALSTCAEVIAACRSNYDERGPGRDDRGGGGTLV